MGLRSGRLKTPFSAIIFCPVSGPCETGCNARLRDPEKTHSPISCLPQRRGGAKKSGETRLPGRKGAEAQRKAGKPVWLAFTLRLCAFAGFRGDMFFPSALKRIGSDMGGQKSGQRKLANLDGPDQIRSDQTVGYGISLDNAG
ncbi:MAG: hypothetical protein B6245_05275 [Desulfobacteraceae bacterium 4572_88]|nr:MAG: hypothetical protein B6245_05275 [Desulfobacteraceae bacterium 4572_88]